MTLIRFISQKFITRPLTVSKFLLRSNSSSAMPLEKIRNIGISAHVDHGKTTLTERILYYTGRIDEMHAVGSRVGATMDSMELERQRGITIQSAATYTKWNDININIIDTPGHVDFTIEVERALRVLDGAVLVICASSGVQTQTLTVNRQMKRYNIPCLAFINKVDLSAANPHRVLEQIRSKLGHNAAFAQLPIGKGENLKGVVDLIKQVAYYFEGDNGEEVRQDEIPSKMLDECNAHRIKLIEELANVDEQIGNAFLEEKEITIADVKAAIRRQCVRRAFTPVFIGTARSNKGVQPLLDAIVDYLPHPGEVENVANIEREGQEIKKVIMNSSRLEKHPFVGLAFKLEKKSKLGQLTYMRCYQGTLSKSDMIINTRTKDKIRASRLVRMHSNLQEDIDEVHSGDIFALVGADCASGDTFVNGPKLIDLSMEPMHVPEPVISKYIKVSSLAERERFAKAIDRFTREDPTYQYRFDPESKEAIVSGMGELHLEIYAQRMEREYDCKVIMGKPKVAFRETLLEPCEFDYLHKIQSGGRGQFGRVKGVLEPLPQHENMMVKFVDKTVGTNVPKQFIPGIKKGFMAMCEKGALTGHKMAGLQFTLLDGANHLVDSSEYSFFQAAQGAVRDVFDNGKWSILEPIMLAEIDGPSEYMATVLADLRKRDGVVIDEEKSGDWIVAQAEVPLNNMFGYIDYLRAQTEGKGNFTMEFARYGACSLESQEQLVLEYQQSLEDENADKKKKKKAK